MRNPFRRKALTATPDVVQAIRDGWAAFPLLGGGSRQRILDVYNAAQNASYAWRYEHSPGVRTVIDCIVRNVGQLELRLFEEQDEAALVARPDHPAALSLRYPSASPTSTITSDGLIRALFLDYLIHNNAYAILEPHPTEAQQITLRRIPSYMVEIQGDSMFEIGNYRVWPQGAWASGGMFGAVAGGAGTFTDIPPENMLHWHGEHPTDPRLGLSILDTLSDVIAEDAALEQASVELANSGFQEAVWMFRPEASAELGQGPRRRLEEDLGNRLRRRNRIPIVLEEGSEFRSFQVSPRDAQAMEIRKWVIERVAAAYGMPLGMVGLDPNVEMARQEFYADVLPPYCEQFCKMLNLRVNVQIYDWPQGSWQFNLDEKLMGDARMTALVSASGGPILLRNEARAIINRPPVKGGDELITPMNVLVGDNPKPSPAVNPVQDANKPPQDGSYRTDQGTTPIASRNPTNKPSNQKAVSVMEAVVAAHFQRLSRSLSTKSRNGGPDWQRWDVELAADMLKAMRKVIGPEAANRANGELEAKATGAAVGLNQRLKEEIEELGLETALARGSNFASVAGDHLGTELAVLVHQHRRRFTIV